MKLRSQSLPWVSGALRHKMNRRYKALKKAKEFFQTEIRAIRSSNGTLVTNDKKKAEVLNNHFATVNVGENLAGNLNNQCTSMELIDRISPTVMEIEVEEESVKKNLSSLNIYKATGPDDLPRILLRTATEEIV